MMTVKQDSLAIKGNLSFSGEELAFLKTDATAIGDMVVGHAEKLFNFTEADTRYETSISDGVSGIVLFMLELYRQTGNTHYLAVAGYGARNLISFYRSQNNINYSFLKGNLGVAYTLLQFHKVSNNQEALDEALAIARNSASEYLYYPYTSNTFFSGRAGSVLVLLHLYAHTGKKWLLSLINQFVNKIVQGADHGSQGIYWRNVSSMERGLCGLPHGSSGIGYTFLELGNFFQNDAFFSVAEQAFSFENFHWDQRIKNWPNDKNQIRDSEDYLVHRLHFRNGNLHFFNHISSSISYASGTAGIGLARCRAYQLLKNETYSADIKTAFETIQSNYHPGHQSSVYEGTAGYGLFALEAYRATGDATFMHFARKVATDLHLQSYLQQFQERSASDGLPDMSLYNGLSGIGYFYLQVLEPEQTPSPVLPAIDQHVQSKTEVEGYPFIDISEPELKRLFLKKVFGRTIYFIENIAMYHFKRYLEQQRKCLDEKMEFQIFVERLIPDLDKKYARVVRSIFELEQKKNMMSQIMENGALVHMREMAHMEEVEKIFNLGQDEFLNLYITINHEVAVVNTVCNPDIKVDIQLPDELLNEDKTYQTLLKPTTQRFAVHELRKTSQHNFRHINRDDVFEIQLNELQMGILSRLNAPKQVKFIVKEMAGLLSLEDMESASIVSEVVCNQIKDDLLLGMLLPSYTSNRALHLHKSPYHPIEHNEVFD